MLNETTIEDVIEAFEFIDDWEERYKYVIELGRQIPPYPEAQRTDENKVRGCTSQVWIHPRLSNDSPPVFQFDGDSDAHIVKGLVSLLILIYSNKTPDEVLKIDARDVLDRLQLSEHLTPMRTNGLYSMVTRIREMAAAAQTGA